MSIKANYLLLPLVACSLLMFGCKKDVEPIELIQPASPPLTVSAGPDITLKIPKNYVDLTGTVSGGNGQFKWQKISGPASGLLMPDGLTARVVFLEEGGYKFKLDNVTNDGLTVSDTVHVSLSTDLNKYLVPNLKPKGLTFTEVRLPDNVFKEIKWVFCKSSTWCEQADAGPSPYVDYGFGSWFYLLSTGNTLNIFGGYSNDEFDLIVYY